MSKSDTEFLIWLSSVWYIFWIYKHTENYTSGCEFVDLYILLSVVDNKKIAKLSCTVKKF